MSFVHNSITLDKFYRKISPNRPIRYPNRRCRWIGYSRCA